uniref:hypothetical protein n=1 Tax=Brucella pseudintermedia TaxID=370111 RepID=UPI00158DA45E|nr:hypothetical protein [Brucella pseudintermedia]
MDYDVGKGADGMWDVFDQLTESIYAAENGPVIELDKHEAREVAEILNNSESFYAGAAKRCG